VHIFIAVLCRYSVYSRVTPSMLAWRYEVYYEVRVAPRVLV